MSVLRRGRYAQRGRSAKGKQVTTPGGQLDEEAHVEDLVAAVFVVALFHDVFQHPVLPGQLRPRQLDARL